MCGIAGFLGYNAPSRALAITLGQLERGTQGSGVAYICKRRIHIRKAPVHPAEFFLKVVDRLPKTCTIAIAHNRQPSKGKVSYENTHPFLACNKEFALVHNGHMFDGKARKIIEKGKHKIQGETDSEIICHLLEDLIREKNSIAKALMALEDYDFSGAVLLLTRNYKIYGLRDSHHPLVIAKQNSTYAIGSTEKAIKVVMKNPEKIIEPKPYQVVKLGYKGLRLIGKGKEPPKTTWKYVYDYDWWKNSRWYW